MENKPLEERYTAAIKGEPLAVAAFVPPLLDSLKEEIEKLERHIIHCDNCGADWYDDGWTGSCPQCRIKELKANSLIIIEAHRNCIDKLEAKLDAVKEWRKLNISILKHDLRFHPEVLTELDKAIGEQE